MWEAVIAFVLTMHPTAQTLLVLAFTGAVWKGFIKLPFINIKSSGKTDADCAERKAREIELEKEKALARDKGERVHRLKYFDTVYDQMSVVETSSVKIFDILTDQFADMLEEMPHLTEQQVTDALQVYHMIVEGASAESCGYLRRWVKKNHIAEMTDVDFQAYQKARGEEVQKLVKKYVDRKYLKSQLFIDRKDVYEANMILFYKSIQMMLSDMFVQIRAIAEDTNRKIEEIERE